MFRDEGTENHGVTSVGAKHVSSQLGGSSLAKWQGNHPAAHPQLFTYLNLPPTYQCPSFPQRGAQELQLRLQGSGKKNSGLDPGEEQPACPQAEEAQVPYS